MTATRNDDDWVKARFSERAIDWTPPAARHLARLLYIPFSQDREMSRRCASLLSVAEREKADRFLSKDDKARFVQRRAFRRWCGARALGREPVLTEIAFEETGKGRPYLRDAPAIGFSFSSCRSGFLGAWSPTHAVGVDIEAADRNLETETLANVFFAEAEARAVARAPSQSFFQFWTLKEAALKSIGEGLPMGLDAFEFELAPAVRMVRAPSDRGGPERFMAFPIGGMDERAALVVRIR